MTVYWANRPRTKNAHLFGRTDCVPPFEFSYCGQTGIQLSTVKGFGDKPPCKSCLRVVRARIKKLVDVSGISNEQLGELEDLQEAMIEAGEDIGQNYNSR